MKKIGILIIIMLLFTLTGVTQEECISCYHNDINFEKYASAIGNYNASLGLSSLASGEANSVRGNYATALGHGNISNGIGSFAVGINCEATGDYAVAFGNIVKARARSSFATGFLSEATGVFSVAMGYGAKAGDHSSIALGFMVDAVAPASFVTGRFVKSTASNAITMGSGNDNAEYLVNNFASTLMVGFNSIYPTLFVSQAPSGGNKTGKIGIGNITNPLAKLHIKADAGEDAAMLITTDTWGSSKWAELRLGNNNNGIRAHHTEGLIFKTENNYLFNSADASVGIGVDNPSAKLEVNGNILQTSGFHASPQIKAPDANGLYLTDQSGDGIFVEEGGNVGIGTSNPDKKLEVAGTIKSTAFQLVNGQQGENKILQSDANGNTNWVNPANIYDDDWTVSGDNIYRIDGNVGIGTDNPGEKLEVGGNIVAENINVTGLKLVDSYQGTGKLLQSDDQGNATWADPNTLGICEWSKSENTLYLDTPYNKLGLFTNNPILPSKSVQNGHFTTEALIR